MKFQQAQIDSTTVRIVTPNDLTLEVHGWVPCRYNRNFKLSRYEENSWRCTISLVMVEAPAIKHNPELAVFSDTNNSRSDLDDLLLSLGIASAEAHVQLVEIIRSVRDAAIEEAAKFNSKVDTKKAKR